MIYKYNQNNDDDDLPDDDIPNASNPDEDEPNVDGEGGRSMKDNPIFLKKILNNYLKQLPVISFNGGKYDINVMKQYFLAIFRERPP